MRMGIRQRSGREGRRWSGIVWMSFLRDAFLGRGERLFLWALRPVPVVLLGRCSCTLALVCSMLIGRCVKSSGARLMYTADPSTSRY